MMINTKFSFNNQTVNSFLTDRISYLETRISDMENYLRSVPEGNLVCRKAAKGNFRYYCNINEKQRYIPLSEIEVAKKLALKKLYKKAIASAREEIAHISLLSENCGQYEKDISGFFSDNPGLFKLLNESANPENEDLEKKIRIWKNEDYRKSTLYPQYLINNTIKGEKVRSKSEAFIADMLFLAGIPYRYECELVIGNEVYYPDFMIMDPDTGDIIIWEHLGLIDLEKYLQRTANKLKIYVNAGYIPNRNLIITSEDNEHPFSGSQAAEVVSAFFHRTIIR